MVKKALVLKAQATVEALIAIAVMVMVIFGAVNLAQGVSIKQALDAGTVIAVREISLSPEDVEWVGVVTRVQQTLNENYLGSPVPVVGCSIYTDMSSNPTPYGDWKANYSAFGEIYSIRCHAPYEFNVPLIGPTTYNIDVRHWGIVERYPNP